MAGSWDGRHSHRPQKARSVETWRKQVRRHFSSHAWREHETVEKLCCANCGFTIWFGLFGAPANGFTVVVSDQCCGWTDRQPMMSCDEMAVENIQEA
jgi:hypothetical protein